MATQEHTTTTRQLFWSEDGQIGCALPTHAPFRGTDTWCRERWRAMTRAEWIQLAAEIGREPECESCAAIARNAR